jgi:hypothetical protein
MARTPRNNGNKYTNNNIIQSKNATNMKGMTSTLDFDFEPSYSFESLQQNSVELLFHYLRFKVFPGIPEERLKKLFYALSFVGCREPEILKEIVAFAEKKDFQEMLAFAENKKIQPEMFLQMAQQDVDSCSIQNNTNTTKKNTKVKVVFYKKPETMIDGWFVEENPFLAYSLFQYLLFSQQDDTYLKSFLENYKSMSPEGRKELVVKPKYNAVTI